MVRIQNNSKGSVPVPLTEKQLVDIFKSLDANGDGVLCQKELKTAFSGWGAWFPGMPTFRANRGISVADANGDGRVDKAEFGDLVKYAISCGYKATMTISRKETTAPQTEKLIQDLLNRHDADKNGLLDKAEVQRAFDELGSIFPSYRTHRGIKIADEDGDGVINMHNNELEKLVKYIMSKNYDLSMQKNLNAS
ncbi:hypothetical protein EZV62_021556 [Acer yangbiense]|uniref:EF-hand domain-containing protein n=1 Tax=Acer yangbiense TaxID=1000413 RepID=A0A5C7H608_9ROSI|nr:hypothetical protein EZV62_021556 [Acer yangbiense]